MQTVAVLDYGMSNLRSVVKALESVAGKDSRIEVAARPEQLLRADRIVFPGQGAIRQCMANLSQLDLEQALRECLKTRPYLGLCLGLQSLMSRSEEDGGTDCLDVLPGEVQRFSDFVRDESGHLCKIPHMGWNQVHQLRPHPLWDGIADGERFYFVHSYYVVPDDDALVTGTTLYIKRFASALARDNLFAVQFHPEKSQKAGLKLLGNFLEWTP